MVPTGQSVQFAVLSIWYDPGGHGEHDSVAQSTKNPGWQCEQFVLSGVAI
jgi:hypothetical protein